jgi:SAM-dependent methyltransferase
VEHLITPIQADACSLPFAQGFFDALVCVNSFMYFGMEDGYLKNLLRFLRTGGQLGMITNGYAREVTDGIPDYIKEYLGDQLWTWQTLSWYKKLWEKNNLVSIDVADTLPNGCGLELRYNDAFCASGFINPFPDERHIHKMDKGEYIGFIRLVATKY